MVLGKTRQKLKKSKRRSPENVKRHLASIIKNNADSLREGCIMSVQEHAVRVRKLPLVL